VLRDRREGLELVFGTDDQDALGALYRDSAAFAPMSALMARALAACVLRLPPERGLRVLEIGAGTGATASHLLRALPPGRVRYTFTDISPAFLARARARFAAHDWIEYRTLDIERDPVEQGFSAFDYDLVLAANVLHATVDLSVALAHVRRLLRPDGMLLLIEGTGRRAWLDLTFGTLPGWWRFRDTSLRETHPLLTEMQWSRLLPRSGFAPPAFASAWSVPEQAPFPQSLIVARPSAEPRAVCGATEQSPAPRVLVLIDREDQHAVMAALSEHGRVPITATPASRFLRLSESAFELDPSCSTQLAALMEAAAPFEAVVYALPALAGDAAPAAQRACGDVLRVVQALCRRSRSKPPQLLVITRGAHAVVDDDRVRNPAHAALWGLTRTIVAEHPELGCRTLDLDPSELEADPQAVWGRALVPGDGPSAHGALRGGRVHVPELERLHPSGRVVPFQLRADGCYLMSGGLGGVGRHVVRWLVDRGARDVVLLGRSAPDASAEHWLRDLRGNGARISYEAVDVADRSALSRCLQALSEQGRTLRAVLHAATVTEDRLLLHHDDASFARVFAAKVAGAWHLHELTLEQPLDQFVLF
jgi:SAM-dependent methyltransferase